MKMQFHVQSLISNEPVYLLNVQFGAAVAPIKFKNDMYKIHQVKRSN